MRAITGEDHHHRVRYAVDGADTTAEAEVVAIVAGRQPRVAGLGLETAAVRHDRHGVNVGPRLETDEPGIFPTDDLVGHPMFAHWATAQAMALTRHLMDVPVAFPLPEHNSAAIFAYPEIVMVGLTEQEARDKGLDVGVAVYDYRADARAQISVEADGLLRIVYRRDDRRILGIHAMIEGAADLMGEAALAVRLGLTVEQLASATRPHPTLTEVFGLAAACAPR
jgi:dihydrolipoamide dehydrogenase